MGLILFVVTSLLLSQAYDCLPVASQQVSLSKAHVNIVRTQQEAEDQFQRIFNETRRLQDRVYWSQEEQQFVFKTYNSTKTLPLIFISNLQEQLLQALNKNYAEFVYYGDMGHLHLLIPQKQSSLSLESEELLSLFHTGELYQFKKEGKIFGNLVDDLYWQWLYWHRNFVGLNKRNSPINLLQAPANAPYNTVRSIEGYKEVGSVYFSANKNGCFHLKNQSVDLRFDISVVF